MSRSKPKSLPAAPVPVHIDALSHDGRGVARIEGKAVFIDGGLPGEDVRAIYTAVHRDFDEAVVVEVLKASPDRVEPRCAHFGVCGGCSMQHLRPENQIEFKQQQLLENLRRIGHLEPDTVLPPLTGPYWGYRRKARLGVKFVRKKGRMMVGFRERHTHFLADLNRCEVLYPHIGTRIEVLRELVGNLSVFDQLPQIEVAAGDDSVALVFRHLQPLALDDEAQLRRFGETHDIAIYLQPKGPDSIHLLWPDAARLSYRLAEYGVEVEFQPSDFTQVNSEINRSLVAKAIEYLAPLPNERVLDLFCGLGNFALALARQARHVTGVEGDEGLVRRARLNAERNGIANATFHTADLNGDFAGAPWARETYDKVLLDPPRSGAQEIVQRLARFGAARVVYVSCNPATLARDAAEITQRQGYRLVSAGVLDMFPHTAHVESIAVFERR